MVHLAKRFSKYSMVATLLLVGGILVVSDGRAVAADDAGGPAAAPSYRRGDAFIYDNGRVERFAGSNDGGLVWRFLSGRKFVRDASFFVPILQWNTSRSKGARILSGAPRKIWPLRPGKSTRFSIVTNATSRRGDQDWKDAKSRRSAQFWKCRTGQETEIEVPAGVFAVLPIACVQFSSGTMRKLRQRIWYYAPGVGHYVRLESTSYMTGRHSVYSLVAALSGRRANRKRLRAIVRAIRQRNKAAS